MYLHSLPLLLTTLLIALLIPSAIFTFTSSRNTVAMSSTTITLAEAFKSRRSIRVITDDVKVVDSRIQEIIHDAVLHTPSPFNAQEGRVVLLLKDEHKKYWDLAKEVVKGLVPAQFFERAYEPRIKMYRAGYGTALFFTDPAPLKAFEAKWPTLVDEFPKCKSLIKVWTTLSAEGLGCSLQHYDYPALDARVSEEWNVPATWKVKSQLVFGNPAETPPEKIFEPVENHRLFVHGA
ncbi:putative fatty acid repression mutant protein [Podospora didyma]|uniref:Fatty acid repression mutant protein n=1 Tax=Podospora didyma TaxID=330526 RepID=A0AAE0K9Y5_9PEZI|nr:putative fatty acid repression mutant protein [Podospora didyma]